MNGSPENQRLESAQSVSLRIGTSQGEEKTCLFCGKRFGRVKNLSNSQWHERRFCSRKCGSTKRTISDKDLISLYVESKMSSNEIGEVVGMSGVHVCRILKSVGVVMRAASLNKKIALNRPDVKEKMRLYSTGRRHSEESKNKLRVIFGSKNANWRQGITKTAGGYLQFTNSKANGEHAGQMIHNMIAEWKYGRELRAGEHVHHIDKNKLNNDPNNLIILTASEHSIFHTEDRENGKSKSM